MDHNTTRNSGPLIAGLLLIGLGILFLIGQFIRIDIWRYLWPLFFVGLGALFFVGMITGGKEAGAAAIPGSLFVMLGLLFLFQSAFDYWASWAYAWSLLVPTSIGIGLIIFSKWSDKPGLFQIGWVLTIVGLAIFLIMGAFFELLVGLSGYASPGRILWPLLLILAGVLLLFGRSFRWFTWPFTAAPRYITPPSPPASDSTQPTEIPPTNKS